MAMTLSNKLTLGRIAIVPFFVLALELDEVLPLPGLRLVCHAAALAMFVAAIVSDYYDGKLARESGQITDFGRLMDPLADKLVVSAAIILLAQKQLVPAWMVIAIVSREFLVTGLRLLGTQKGRVIAADRWGKVKTVAQMVAIVAALLVLGLRDLAAIDTASSGVRASWLPPAGVVDWTLWGMFLVVVALAMLSGGLYLWVNRQLIAESGA
jgi:CDP-diacylglycerol--glycerol-3-phosphate 3-phosphatidyltransferase